MSAIHFLVEGIGWFAILLLSMSWLGDYLDKQEKKHKHKHF
jgi:hypothetical protein